MLFRSSYGWLSNADADFDGVTIDLTDTSTGGQGTAIGKDSSEGLIFTDTLSNIEEAWGSKYADTILGSTGNNWLGGEDGNDNLNGNSGQNHLWGGQGEDALNGGSFSYDDTTRNYVTYKDDLDFDGDGNGVNVSINYDSNSGSGHDFSGTTATDGWGTEDDLENFSRIVGSDFDDTLKIGRASCRERVSSPV